MTTEIENLRLQIAELTDEVDRLRGWVEHYQDFREDYFAFGESWSESMDIGIETLGDWARMYEEHEKMRQDWNELVPVYNALVAAARGPRERGRPRSFTDAQAETVRKHRHDGRSIRAIAAELDLSVQAVRTILSLADRPQRERQERRYLVARELNREAAARYRARAREAQLGPRAKRWAKDLKALEKSKPSLLRKE